jgi:hypothetical protein
MARVLTDGTRTVQRAGGVCEVRTPAGRPVWRGPVLPPNGAPYDHPAKCTSQTAPKCYA